METGRCINNELVNHGSVYNKQIGHCKTHLVERIHYLFLLHRTFMAERLCNVRGDTAKTCRLNQRSTFY